MAYAHGLGPCRRKPWGFESLLEHQSLTNICHSPTMADMPYGKVELRAYLIKRYHEQRAFIIRLLGGRCSLCGSSSRLEVDHRDPQEKKYRVGTLWGERSFDRLFAELEKCQLLCYGCHRKKTGKETSARQTGRFSHGTIYAWMKVKCKCEECVQAKRAWHDKRNASRRFGNGYGPRF